MLLSQNMAMNIVYDFVLYPSYNSGPTCKSPEEKPVSCGGRVENGEVVETNCPNSQSNGKRKITNIQVEEIENINHLFIYGIINLYITFQVLILKSVISSKHLHKLFIKVVYFIWFKK